MKISDALSGKTFERLARGTIKKGDVFRITMSRDEGIIPKPGDDTRDKFFAILGFDSCGNAYGGVVVNSRINDRLPNYIKILHKPLSCEKYSFLRYDSFVDCSEIKCVPLGKFNEWKYLGVIDNTDINTIIETVKNSPKESKAHLALFGL